MDKYKYKSVEELAEVLKVLASKNQGPGVSAELRNLVSMFKAHKLRHSADAHAFCRRDGMQVLLDLLSTCEGNSKDLLLVLGTIGNLCALSHHPRTKVNNFCVCKMSITFLTF